jgi:hypothetical protein
MKKAPKKTDLILTVPSNRSGILLRYSYVWQYLLVISRLWNRYDGHMFKYSCLLIVFVVRALRCLFVFFGLVFLLFGHIEI